MSVADCKQMPYEELTYVPEQDVSDVKVMVIQCSGGKLEL
jgi:hypothetical protein